MINVLYTRYIQMIQTLIMRLKIHCCDLIVFYAFV